jgi:hypothetical protein
VVVASNAPDALRLDGPCALVRGGDGGMTLYPRFIGHGRNRGAAFAICRELPITSAP